MPRIVFECPGNKKYCIWCDQVPPPLGGGPGLLIIPNIERKRDPTNIYDYLEFQLLTDDSNPVPPEDIHIKLYKDPEEVVDAQTNTIHGKVEMPYNGGRSSEGVFTIKMGTL